MKQNDELWYVRDGDQVTGPFTQPEVDALRDRGDLKWSHEVSQDGLIWVSASTLMSASAGNRGKGSGSSSSTRSSSDHGAAGRGATVVFGMVIVAMAIGLIWRMREVLLGYDSKGAEAIQGVLRENASAGRDYLQSVGPTDPPSYCARAIAAYVSRMRAVGTAECPEDFQEAFKRHLEAWQELHAAVDALPDSFLEGFFVGALNGLKRGEADGGTSRMAETVKRALGAVNITDQEVKKIAARYDVASP